MTVKVTAADGTSRMLHSLYDPQREAKGFVDAFADPGHGLVLVLGLGLGYHLEELAGRFPDAQILVVEGSPEVYELAASAGRLGRRNGRVQFVVGAAPAEAVREITRRQIGLGMVPLSVFVLPAALSAFPDYYQPIAGALKKAAAAKVWEKLKYPKFAAREVRVGLIDFGYFLTREVERALGSAGHRTSRVTVGKGQSGEAIVARLLEIVVELRPDFLLTVNHLGFDEDGVLTDFLRSIEMPVASWFVDSPNLILKGFRRNVSPWSAIFVWDRAHVGDVKRMGFEAVHYLPLGADPAQFRPIPASHPKVRRHRCAIGFVGHSMVSRVDKWLSKLRPELRPLVEILARELLRRRVPYERFVREIPEEMGLPLRGLSAVEGLDLERAVVSRSTQLYRLGCLAALRGRSLRVHGDEGWKGLLDPDVRVLPPLDYYRDLPFFYNGVAVNLNATSLQMEQAVNQRVFDVPACGAFLLTDHQQAIEELFEAGAEIVTYREAEEIAEKADYYLRRPEARCRVAALGRKRVLLEHTYGQRVKTIVEAMRSRYASS
ncbi:MAG: glycosyltransferase [bacterium]